MHLYVLGFAFVPSTNQVLLVRKKRPEWQAGLLNGIGGKIEKGETPAKAMLREGMEEAALSLDWQYRGMLTGINDDDEYFVCHVYRAADEEVAQFLQMEDEALALYDIVEYINEPHIKTLEWMIPLLRQDPKPPSFQAHHFHAQYYRRKDHG